MTLKNYLSIDEAARLKGVSRQALYAAEKKGRLKIERVGNCALINKSELEKYNPNPASVRAGTLSKQGRLKRQPDKSAAKNRTRKA